MGMLKIAERDLRKYKENYPNDGYGYCCYKSAFNVIKAFEEEMDKGGHSGTSAAITRDLVINWLKEKPIFAVNDEDFELFEYQDKDGDCTLYYFNGIFKKVFKSGEVEYHDVDRVVYHDTYDGKDSTWHNQKADMIVDEFVGKITMPYQREHIDVYGKDMYLDEDGNDKTKENRGSYNFSHIDYILREDGTKIIVDRDIDYRDEEDDLEAEPAEIASDDDDCCCGC